MLIKSIRTYSSETKTRGVHGTCLCIRGRHFRVVVKMGARRVQTIF